MAAPREAGLSADEQLDAMQREQREQQGREASPSPNGPAVPMVPAIPLGDLQLAAGQPHYPKHPAVQVPVPASLTASVVAQGTPIFTAEQQDLSSRR